MDSNVSVMIQPELLYQINLAIPALAAIISAVLVGVVSYYANKHLEKEKAKIADILKRRQIYSQLKGQECVISQVYVSRYEAFIHFQFERARYILEVQKWKAQLAEARKNQKWTPDLQRMIDELVRNHPAGPESDRLLQKAENLAMEIAKNQKRLFEILGQIEVLFPDDPEMKKRIERLNCIDDKFVHRFEIPKPFDDKTEAQLDLWADMAVKDLVGLVELEIKIPIDELLYDLKNIINKEI
jgi:hypothetical protein